MNTFLPPFAVVEKAKRDAREAAIEAARMVGWRRGEVRVQKGYETSKEAVEKVHEGDSLTYGTLKEAVKKVHEDDSLTTIIVGEGEHEIDGDYLEISSAMNIVGDPGVPLADIVIVGGISIRISVAQGLIVDGPGCHLQHLTIKGNGSVVGYYSSFTMEDVLVTQCGGVVAFGEKTNLECTNVRVENCEIGFYAKAGALITLIGDATQVSNCKRGLVVGIVRLIRGDPRKSTIQVLSPLTREKVCEGGNDKNFDFEVDTGDLSISYTWCIKDITFDDIVLDSWGFKKLYIERLITDQIDILVDNLVDDFKSMTETISKTTSKTMKNEFMLFVIASLLINILIQIQTQLQPKSSESSESLESVYIFDPIEFSLDYLKIKGFDKASVKKSIDELYESGSSTSHTLGAGETKEGLTKVWNKLRFL
jgi:hypothetical protein